MRLAGRVWLAAARVRATGDLGRAGTIDAPPSWACYEYEAAARRARIVAYGVGVRATPRPVLEAGRDCAGGG